MEAKLRILMLGDIVGPESEEYVEKRLWSYRKENNIDACIANGENLSVGNGIEPDGAERLFKSGVDVITTGNHIWQKKGIYDYLDTQPRLLRPANYPGRDPGQGSVITEIKGYNMLVFNLSGTVYMDALANPFDTADGILSANKGKYDFSVLDFHAEATSEKCALGHYLDGRVSAVCGTHTHIETADERILPHGTAYVTDLGMCGPLDSVLGIKKEIIVEKFRTKMPGRFIIAEGGIVAHGVIITVNAEKGTAESIKRIVF